MKHRSLILISLLAVVLFLGTTLSATAAVLSLQPTSDGSTEKTTFLRGDDLYLNIEVDNAAGIAGATFTLVYPTDVLTAPVTSAEGVSSDITSIFPFSFTDPGSQVTTDTHRENSTAELGKIYFSGATIDTSDGGARYDAGDMVLFTVKFTVNGNATYEDFSLALEQTMLFNTAAGWGTDVDQDGVYDVGDDAYEAAPVLVGAVDNQNPGWNNLDCVANPGNCAFPVLLGVGGPAFTTVTRSDLFISDGDNIDDAWELSTFGDLVTATDSTDADQDGYLDRYEQPSANNTNPNSPDEPFGDNYDASTDLRGPYQHVYTDPASPKAGAGNDFSMSVMYETTDGNQAITGLGLRIHYDSSKMTWSSVSDVLSNGLTIDPGTISAESDTANYDGDLDTDMFVHIAWSVVSGNWPDDTMPTKLYTITFTVDAGLSDGDTSTIRFSSSSTAAGYEFYGNAADFVVQPFNLDIDGNGTADALTDGILVIRYLFGFTGNTLISNAVAPDCTRCTAPEIEAWLADGVSSGLLDIDGNGVADALTDGILIIRYLFGFTGNTLINGAVAPDCTRCTAPEIEAHLAQIMPQ